MAPAAARPFYLLALLLCVAICSSAPLPSWLTERRSRPAAKDQHQPIANNFKSSAFLPVLVRGLGSRRLDDVADDEAGAQVDDGDSEKRKEDEVADEGNDGSGNDGDNDEDGNSDTDDDNSKIASRGSGFHLVLLPTILLGLAFTIYMLCRWCKTRNDTVAFGQVDEYLSEFDGDESESNISSIEAASMSYSEGGSTQSPAIPLQRIPTPPSTITQAEDGEMI